MVSFSDDKRFVGVWFVYPPTDPSFPRRRADWFCAMWLNPDDTLEFSYRFHYYDDPSSPAGGERSWYSFRSREPVAPSSLPGHAAHMTELGKLNVLRNQTKMEYLDCNLSPGSEVVAALSETAWWHQKEAKVFSDN